MAVIQPIGQEIGSVYNLVSPQGDIATFNSPGAENYVGPLSAVTGLDSPEVVESFGMNVERDGGFSNNFFFGRRTFTLAGQIVPASTSDRLTKLARLTSASLAMQEDGTLEWLTSSGVRLFLKFRRQQPLVTSEAWVKDFLFTGVAADPRIYSTEGFQQYLSMESGLTEDSSIKMSFSSGSATTVGSWPLSVVEGQTVKIRCFIKVPSTWTGGTPRFLLGGIAGTLTATVPFNPAVKNSWQEVIFTLVPTETKTGTLKVDVTSKPTVGETIEFALPLLQSENFTGTIGTSESLAFTAETGWSRFMGERPPYNMFAEGNYPAPVLAEIFGPFTGFKLENTQTGHPYVQATLTLVKGERLVIDMDKKTATIMPSGADAYGDINFNNTNWWSVPTIAGHTWTTKLVSITGGGASTGAIIKWRDTWI